MSKQLSEAQIEHLHEFCQKHYVPYYDVQVELVDHLASAIEGRWENEPNIGFEQALNDIYREFGVGGFSKVRMEKEMHLMKKYQRMLWQYVGQFYKFPKIILTIALSFLVFILFCSTGKDSLIVFIYIALVIVFELLFYIYIYPKYYSIRKISKKKFVMANIFRNVHGGFILMPILVFNLFGFLGDNKSFSFPIWLELLASILLVTFTFLIISFSFYIPKKIREHFKEQFPQFVKA